MSSHSFKSAVSWNLIGSIARIGISLGFQLALLRLLGPLPAGQFALFLFVVGIGAILSEGGMMVTLARAPVLDEQLMRGALFLILCYSLATSLLLIAFSVPLMRLFQIAPPYWYIPVSAALNVIPMALTSVPISALKQQYRAREIQMLQLGAYVAGYGLVGLPLAIAQPSVLVLVLAFSVQSVTCLIGGLIVSRCPLIPHWRGVSAIRGVSSRALLVNMAGYVNESAPSVFTAHTLGAHPVGMYSTAFNLLRMPTDIAVSALHAPLLVSTARDDGGNASQDRFLSTLNVLATTVFAVYVVAFLCGQQIILPLLGPKWLEAGPVLAIVSLIMAARLISNVSGAVVWGQGRLMLDLGAQLASIAVLLGGFLLISPASVLGVGWIVLASYLVRVGIQLAGAMRAITVTARQMLHALVAPAALTVLVMLPMRWVGPVVASDGSLLGLILLGAASALLLSLRILIGTWCSPYAWSAPIRRRVARLIGSGVEDLEQMPIADPAKSDQTLTAVGRRL